MSANKYKISTHALKRWNERCPGEDILKHLESARQNRYHPAAIRAIAGYKTEGERFYLVCHNGIVFVVSYERGDPEVVTVLLPYRFVHQASERDIQAMSEDELKKELKVTEKKLADIAAIRSPIGNQKRLICDRLSELKKGNQSTCES